MRKLLLLICLVLISQQAAAWLIVGDSVLEEDSQFSLTVTPHTATSPVKKFSQAFVLCNKTASAQTVYAAYLFNSALKSGKVEYWQQPAYGWVSKEFVCRAGASFVYQLNKFPGAQNPSWAKCYITIHDTNGYAPDRNQVFFDGGFKTGSIPTRTINFDENKLVSGNTWFDVTAGFTDNKQVLNGRYIYPYTAGLSMPAGSCKQWRISYEPATSDNSKKWDLWLWAGSNWNCILTGTCVKVVKLDPWWNANWTSKKAIQLPNQDMNAGETIQIEGINFSGMNVLANLNDVRVVDENLNVEIDRLCDGTSTSTDGNCFFFLDYNFTKNDSGMNTTYYLYYDNPVAGAPPDDNVERTRVCNFENGECEFTNVAGIVTTPVLFGSYDLKTTVNSGSTRYFDSSFATTGTWDWNYSAWVRVGDATWYSVFRIGTAVDHTCSIGTYGDTFYVLYDAGQAEAYFGNPTDDTWYKFIIHYKNGDANCGYMIKNTAGENVIPPFSFSLATTGQTVPIKLTVGNYPSGTNITYASNVFRGMPFKAVGLGAEELAAPPDTAPYTANIDLNVTYAKQNGHIKVTAHGAGDFEDDNITLLCGTSPSPAIDTNNFCTDFGNASPYSDVSCFGYGAGGDANTIIYCRAWDGMKYSVDQNIAAYTADNTAPATSFSRLLLTVTFSCSDSSSGCGITRYNLDTTGWIGANSFTTGYGSHTFDYYSIDNVGNVESVNYGSFTLTGREIDPANISNQNFFDIGRFMSYKAFLAVASIIGVLFLMIFALIALRAVLFK